MPLGVEMACGFWNCIRRNSVANFLVLIFPSCREYRQPRRVRSRLLATFAHHGQWGKGLHKNMAVQNHHWTTSLRMAEDTGLPIVHTTSCSHWSSLFHSAKARSLTVHDEMSLSPKLRLFWLKHGTRNNPKQEKLNSNKTPNERFLTQFALYIFLLSFIFCILERRVCI